MCVYCAQVGKAAGGFGCADVPAMTVDAKSDARAVDLQGGATFAPTIATDDPVSQNPGPGGDTVPGTTSTTFSVTNDAYVRGYINTSGDQDWYQVTLTAGQQYTFFLNGFGVGAIRDPYVRVFNAAGVLVAENDDSGPLNGSRLSYAPSASGTYYVSAGGYVPPIGAGSTGQYLLTMNDGGSPFSPTVSLTDVADYLSNSYWEVNGVAPAKWNITSITYKTTGLEPERAVLARIAFQAWADVTGLTFTEITSGTAKITLDDTTANAAFENSTTSGGVINSATINVSTDWYGGIDAIDSYTLQTFIHEIGHSLGLGHGGPYNGSANPGVDNVYANDSWHLSVMSYFDQFEMNVSSFRFIMTPEMADILAVQRYYGTPNTRPGDTIYGFGSNAGFTVVSGSGIQAVNLYNFAAYTQAPAFTIYDGAGIDTLDASGYSQTQLIDLRGGNFSHIGGLTGNIGIYTTTVIENAIGGSGNDTIIGNSAANTISGGDGLDTAVYSSATLGIVVNLATGLATGPEIGTDHLNNIENVIGGSGDDQITGDAEPNQLIGGHGADTITGSEGKDVVDGGAGNDEIVAGSGAGDDTYDGGTDIDTIKFSSATQRVTIDLAARVAVGVETGSDKIFNIENVIGGSGNDIIGSDGSANVLDGAGGLDTVSYYTNPRGVAINLAAGTANDGIVADSLSNFENANGSAFNDTIAGTNGTNVLNGLGGVDTVTYATAGLAVVVDLYAAIAKEGVATDSLLNFENVNGSAFNDAIGGNHGANVLNGLGGIDTVSYYAAKGAVTINLALGTAVIGTVTDSLLNFENANGSTFADQIIGDTKANELNGQGGIDVLTGGDGNDTFTFNRGQAHGDTVTDFIGNGAGVGDQLRFVGYGAGPKSFTRIDDTHWQITFDGGTEILTFSNGAAIVQNDYVFV